MSSVQDRREGAIRTRHRPSVPGAPFIPDLEKAAAGGVATLDEMTALVPDAQLATGAAAAGKALLGDRTWGDVATQVELDAEVTARGAADAAETAARIADVDAEEAARIAADAAHVAAADPHAQYQKESERNAANGYAGLDAASHLPANSVDTTAIVADAVTYPKIQNVSATDKLLGRSTAGAGDIEEITCTAAARSILDDATVAAILATLGGAAESNGNWVPTDASGAAIALTVSGCIYRKLGKTCTVYFDIQWAVNANGLSVLVDGLPFTANTPNAPVCIAFNTSGIAIIGRTLSNTKFELRNAATNALIINSQLSGKELLGSITFETT